jgi:putative transcriptional regulator
MNTMRKAIQIRIKIRELLEKRGYTQKQFAQMTGLREATISELANGQRTTLNKEQLCTIATHLQVDDINDLIEFVWSNE